MPNYTVQQCKINRQQERKSTPAYLDNNSAYVIGCLIARTREKHRRRIQMSERAGFKGVNRRQELEEQGWERRFAACEPRLSEARELYESLGYEVLLEPLPEDPAEMGCGGQDGCTVCFEEGRERYRVIFTRKRK